MRVTLIAGARPNFMKIAPIIHAIREAQTHGSGLTYRLVHTGQHYDDKLSRIFFEQLNIPEADINLGAGSGTQAEQTARIMVEFEKELLANPCDLVIVVGDVTSTLACTIVAKKLHTKVAHVEGGIRSFDLEMPEEINRMVTDSITDYFFTTSEVANLNLRKAGISEDRIFFVGNTMIDSLQANLAKATRPALWEEKGLAPKQFYVLTLHRPSNVDNPERLRGFLKAIGNMTKCSVVFPVHPRTARNLNGLGNESNLILTDPMSYLEFIYLLKEARGVITDSGGVQEETTVLGIPCVTMRKSTERPETVTIGSNQLVGDDLGALEGAILRINEGKWKKGMVPERWDGNAAARIVRILETTLG